MPWLLTISVVLALIAAAATVSTRNARRAKDPDKEIEDIALLGPWVVTLFAGLAILTLGFASVTIVSTRIAEESQKTARAQAEANRILASSVTGEPNVLVARCLDLVNSGKPLPAGFQCWPGTGVGLSIPVK